MKRPQPIHAFNQDIARHLIGKAVLCAQHKEGLGYYGTLIGFCSKTGKFIVKRLYDKNESRWMWIIEDTVGNNGLVETINEIDEVVI